MSEVIAITGGSGFLAAHLATTCAARGHHVICLSRSAGVPARLRAASSAIVHRVWDPGQPEAAFAQIPGLSAVIHAATCYGRASESFSELIEANVLVGMRVAEAAIATQVRKIVAIGTSLPAAVSSYAASKADGAAWLRRHADRLAISEARCEHFYGAGDDPSKFTARVLRACLADDAVLELTSGEQRRDFLHVTDAAIAICTLLERMPTHAGWSSVDVGSGNSVTVRYFVELIHRLAKSSIDLRFGALPLRAHEPSETRADISHLQAMGWSQQFDLHAGIQRMIDEERAQCAS